MAYNMGHVKQNKKIDQIPVRAIFALQGTNAIFGEKFSKDSKMGERRATIETLYSKGPIDPIPDIGPKRSDIEFQNILRVEARPGGTEVLETETQKNHVEMSQTSVPKVSSEVCKDPHQISGAFWAYVVITAIVGVIGALFAFDSYRDPWLRNLKKSAAFPTETIFFVGSFIALLFIIWAAYRGHIEAPDDMYRYVLIYTFVINLILIIIWAAVFFSRRDPKTAFFVALLLILVTVWWIWLVWPIDQVAGTLLILYLIWLVYVAWFCWDLVCKNNL